MAIVISICRGVMHHDDGCTAWVDKANFYRGNGYGQQTPAMPIFRYARALHDNAENGLAYAFSYDDVYGEDPSIYFSGKPNIQVTLSQM